jgi:hypothetical protein
MRASSRLVFSAEEMSGLAAGIVAIPAREVALAEEVLVVETELLEAGAGHARELQLELPRRARIAH